MGEILEILAATFYDFKKKKTFFFDYRPCKRDERRVCGGGGCRNHCSNGQGNVPANGNADWNTTKTDERFLLSAPHFVNIGPRARSYLSDTPGPFRLPILLLSEPSSREFCVLFFLYPLVSFFVYNFPLTYVLGRYASVDRCLAQGKWYSLDAVDASGVALPNWTDGPEKRLIYSVILTYFRGWIPVSVGWKSSLSAKNTQTRALCAL